MTSPSPLVVSARRVREALALEGFDARRAQRDMEPARRGPRPPGADARPPRRAAALAYVFPRGERLHLPLTVRRPDLPEHRGQVSLPGGRPGPGESLWATALREAEEEIGLATDGLDWLGTLAPVYIPVTHTHLHVHVAHGPAPEALVPCPREVERIELVALDELLEPARRARTRRTIQGQDVDVPYFDVNGLFLWGATAMALSELVARIRRTVSRQTQRFS